MGTHQPEDTQPGAGRDGAPRGGGCGGQGHDVAGGRAGRGALHAAAAVRRRGDGGRAGSGNRGGGRDRGRRHRHHFKGIWKEWFVQ